MKTCLKSMKNPNNKYDVINMTYEGEYYRSISLRCDEKLCNMIDELEEELLLNTSSILRMAIRLLYLQEIDDEMPNVSGDD